MLKTNTGGVFYWDSGKKWIATLRVNGKHFQRHFAKKEDAVAYRRAVIIKHLGEDYYNSVKC